MDSFSEIYTILIEDGLCVHSISRFRESIRFLDESLKITVFKDGRVLFVYKNVKYIYDSQFGFKHFYDSFNIFVESNVVVLHSGTMFTSFVFENDTFQKIGDYSIGNFICRGILILVERTPYFVCCVNPSNSPLIVVSINLITGQQNRVLEMGEDKHFDSFKTRNGSLFIKTFDYLYFSSTETAVDPLKIHETRESWRQDRGIIWEKVRRS